METRARLVEAAKEVFELDGFLDARISDIAERAGLSHGSFYHYFDSKEEVFREVAAEVEERLSEPINSVILDPSSTATPLRTHPRGHPATPRELPRRGPDHAGDRAGVTVRPDMVERAAPRRHDYYRERSQTRFAVCNGMVSWIRSSTPPSPPPAWAQ